MATHKDYSPLFLTFVLITLASTSGRVILAHAHNFFETNLFELRSPEQAEFPEAEAESPTVELPMVPQVADHNRTSEASPVSSTTSPSL